VSDNNTEVYQGVVNLSTAYAFLVIRIEALSNTTEELSILQGYQNATELQLKDLTAASAVPSLSDVTPQGGLQSISEVQRQLEFAARVLPYNPGEVISDRERVSEILAKAGISNGTYTPQRSVNLTCASAMANSSISSDSTNPTNLVDLGNGWTIPVASHQGNFGTNYAAAAAVALAGGAEQTQAQALYPIQQQYSNDTVFTLKNNTSLLFTFVGKPPVVSPGFWNIGAYGSDLFLIENTLNRYNIGSLNFNMTYPTGEKIYGPDSNASVDGQFQVLLQQENLPPPANWTGHWLPVTEAFFLVRKYYATGM
jgi:hypothetical protein